MGAFSNHHGELGFVVNAADAGREPDRVAGTDDAGAWLEEHQRFWWQFLSELGGVVLVVEADADHLARNHRGEHFRRTQAAGHGAVEIVAAEEVVAAKLCSPEFAAALDGEKRLAVLRETIHAIHRRHSS